MSAVCFKSCDAMKEAAELAAADCAASGSAATLALDGVTLLSHIGEGGMGSVFKAWHNRLNIPVAVKILKDASPDNLPHFHREGRLTAQLDHPNLIKVYDIDTDRVCGQHYMVMEYIKGCTAFGMLELQFSRFGRPLSEVVAVDICLSVAKAMGAVHRAGIVHRDVKSENILIRASDGAVKLTDFGLAAFMSDARREASISKGAVAGTIGFLSPELVRGAAPTPASDVYALGATLFELLTGALPFGAPYDHTYNLRQNTEPPLNPRAVAPSLSDAVVAIVERCLEKDPAKRFADGDSLARALQGALAALTGNKTAGVSGMYGSVAACSSRPLILCVDDDKDVLDTIRDTMDFAGFNTACYSDPAMALRDLEKINPDVAVVDLMMPGMNGVELAQAFRKSENFKELAVLILSGAAHNSTILSALDRGITDYLTKPLCIDELVVRVKLLFKLRVMSHERRAIETQLLQLKKHPVSAVIEAMAR